MPGLTIEALMGHKPDEEDESPAPAKGGDDMDFDDLSPAEVIEHLHAASESAVKACQEGSAVAFAKALEAMVKLIELKGDSKMPEDDGGDEEEGAPESEE